MLTAFNAIPKIGKESLRVEARFPVLLSVLIKLYFTTILTHGSFSDPRIIRSVGTSGVHIGAALEWSQDIWGYSVENVNKTIGYDPRSYIIFTQFPLTSDDLWVLSSLVPAMGAQGQTVILTVEPYNGLENITSEMLDSFLETITFYENEYNTTFIVRFGHEMNGSWYPWCQQPLAFKLAFRRLAMALRNGTQYATMMFAPNIGPGYPYDGGEYLQKCDEGSLTAECEALDTNKDGKVTEDDDMFSPYWPGDDVVDWVGSSLYWWGYQYPWGENDIPQQKNFYDTLMGNAKQESGAPIPDFYRTYSEDKQKPMIISETAALYNLCDQNKDTDACKVNIMNDWINPEQEFSVKSSWWDQVFSLSGDTSTYEAFPNIRIICWFNIRKKEAEVEGNTVDWTTFTNKSIREAFIEKLGQAPTNEAKYWITNADSW